MFPFTAEDLDDLGVIGEGAFGTVNKMIHRPSSTVMAVKVGGASVTASVGRSSRDVSRVRLRFIGKTVSLVRLVSASGRR